MFLEPGERLIAVDQKVEPMSLESKIRLRDSGIRTLLCEGFVSWQNIAPTPYTFNVDLLDRLVDENREAGLKTMLSMYNQVPMWVPGAIVTRQNDPNWHTPAVFLSPFNSAGFEEELDFLDRVLDHFDIAGDVCCYYATPGGGERVVPAGLGGATAAEAVKIATTRQSVFADYLSDLWTCFHPAAIPDNVGNEHLDAVHAALLEKFPIHTHHRILWTFFTSEGCQWQLDYDSYWVGAEYATNVVKNARRISDWGAYGLIMAPTRWHDGPVVVTDKEIAEIEKALEILGEY